MRITIGVTTYNEKKNIMELADTLLSLSQCHDIIIFDDCSTDETQKTLKSHQLNDQPSVRMYFADVNHGGPSVGRQFIATQAQTDFVTLLDGDDLIDVAALNAVVEQVPLDADMIITPYNLRGTLQKINDPAGFIKVHSSNISRLISGIGGKIYKKSVLEHSICHEFVGRSEDARLNMNALLGSNHKIFHNPDYCFYLIEESRKSRSAKQIRIDEFEWRINRYKKLMSLYRLDDSYLYAVKRNFMRVVEEDDRLDAREKQGIRERLNQVLPNNLKTVISLCNDLSVIGGVATRTLRLLKNQKKGGVRHLAISRKNSRSFAHRNHYSCSDDGELLLAELEKIPPHEAVVICQNSILIHLPPQISSRLKRYPLVHICDAQLAYMLQHSPLFGHSSKLEDYRASKIICFSDMDIILQKQLGIFGQVKGFLSVEQRKSNAYKIDKYYNMGYVGIIDFKAKASHELIGLIKSAKRHKWPKLRIFTTDAGNSPDLPEFAQMLKDENLEGDCELILNEHDKEKIFSGLGWLILPSAQESFGNVILEAYSFGVPVIAKSSAAGPSELVQHGKTGFLLEDISGENIISTIAQNKENSSLLSDRAFERHKNYSDEKFASFLEGQALETLNYFWGVNRRPVFPALRSIQELRSLRSSQEIRIKDVKLEWQNRLKKSQNSKKYQVMMKDKALAACYADLQRSKTKLEELQRSIVNKDAIIESIQDRLLKAELKLEKLKRDNTLAYQLGRKLIDANSSPASFFRLPLDLWKIRRQAKMRREQK